MTNFWLQCQTIYLLILKVFVHVKGTTHQLAYIQTHIRECRFEEKEIEIQTDPIITKTSISLCLTLNDVNPIKSIKDDSISINHGIKDKSHKLCLQTNDQTKLSINLEIL